MSQHTSPQPPARAEINKAPGQPTGFVNNTLSRSQSPPAQQQSLVSGVATVTPLNGSSEARGGRSEVSPLPQQGGGSGGCGYDPMQSVASDFFGNSLSSLSNKELGGGNTPQQQQQQQPTGPSASGGCPFKGVCGPPTTDSQQLVSSEAWSPSGGYDGLMDITVDTIEVLGVGGAAYFLAKLFDQYLQAPKESGLRSPELARAFVTACQLQCRRACMIIKGMLPKIAALDELDKEGSIALATLLCDMSCCLQTAKILFHRNKGTKVSALYYNALIRVATESSRVVDLNFAVEVANELTSHGFKLSTVSIRLILGGFSRHPEFSVKTCFNVMNWRLAISSSNIEACFANHFFQSLETTPGNQVEEALAYLRGTMATRCPNLERSLIVDALPPGQDGKSQCCMCEESSNSRIYLVDPFTLIVGQGGAGPTPNSTPKSNSLSISNNNKTDQCQLNALAEYILPKGTYAFFLYSAIRDMCSKSKTTGEDHPLHCKLSHVKNLLAANPLTTWVLTLDEELEMRPPECPLAVSHHCRLMSTFSGMMMDCSAGEQNCKFTLVTADPALEAAAAHQFPGHVAKTLPFPMNTSK